jgi:hypothetical protein
MRDISLSFIRSGCMGVCLYLGLNACFPDVLTKAQIKIAFPLHSLVKEIQEWIAVSDRLRRLRGAS